MVMGEGKKPTLSHLLKLADLVNIKKDKALEIVNDVGLAITKWPIYSKDAGVSHRSQKMIQLALD